jgi:16S rRNA (guanine1516-N2)-methyltransferase
MELPPVQPSPATVPLGVTVSGRAGPEAVAQARQRALAWGLPWFERPAQGGLEPLLAGAVKALLVYGGTGWVLRDAQGQLGCSPGMARVRIKRLLTGVQMEDFLVRLGELRPGDQVVDGTLGLAADALVCAHVVGPAGRVVGIEASRALFLLVSEGLAPGRSPQACPIEVRFGDALEVLGTMPAGSADCVYLDAMFARPRKGAPTFEMLRRFAHPVPLSQELVDAARRVARRWVVIKTGRYGGELKRLGISPVVTRRPGPLQWARLAPL